MVQPALCFTPYCSFRYAFTYRHVEIINFIPPRWENEYIFSSFQHWPWPPDGVFIINNAYFPPDLLYCHYYGCTNVLLTIFVFPNLIQTVIIIYRSTGGLFHHSDLHTFSPRCPSFSVRRAALMDQHVDVHSSDGLLCLSKRVNPCESGSSID